MKRVFLLGAGVNNQKYDNLLNLALQLPEEVLEQSEMLESGYEREENRWEVVIKYHGSLQRLAELGIEVEEMIAGYAILLVPEEYMERLGEIQEIEYVEKPRNYYTQQIDPVDAVEGGSVKRRARFLSGRGVMIAILDSGVDVKRPEFRKEDGSTRILYYYDLAQGGEIYTQERLNRYLAGEGSGPGEDVTGHGTAVAGIAAGSIVREENGRIVYEGIANEADILVVKIFGGRERGFARTTDIMRGVTFALTKAREEGMPLVINLSYGNTYGPHDGSSLLERFLDNASEIGRTIICVGSGNEGYSNGHFSGTVRQGEQVRISFGIAPYERNLSLQLWKHYGDEVSIVLETPGGQRLEITEDFFGQGNSILFGKTRVLGYYGTALPYSVNQEIYLELIAQEEWIESGVWHLWVQGYEIQNGKFDIYMQGSSVRNLGTGFLNPNPELTLTAPGSAQKVITVGAYNPATNAYADFSGRGGNGNRNGFLRGNGKKPDLSAAGVDIVAPVGKTGYEGVTGTSFATPLISGSGALFMEWGIVKGNDPFLYGEKLKAYLCRNTFRLNGMEFRPDDKSGYGGFTFRNAIV